MESKGTCTGEDYLVFNQTYDKEEKMRIMKEIALENQTSLNELD
jgi:hypothetical protein